LEKGEPDLVDRLPRPVREAIINREMFNGIAVQAVVMTVAVLGTFLIAGAHPLVDLKDPMLPRWEAVAFATLVLSGLLRAFTARSERTSLFKIGVFSNTWMVNTVLFSFALVLAAINVPFLNPIFETVPLTFAEWLWIVPFALFTSITAEVIKIYLRARAQKIETCLTAQMELA
jgi:Ca2+-transporting ATPase